MKTRPGLTKTSRALLPTPNTLTATLVLGLVSERQSALGQPVASAVPLRPPLPRGREPWVPVWISLLLFPKHLSYVKPELSGERVVFNAAVVRDARELNANVGCKEIVARLALVLIGRDTYEDGH